MRAEGDTIDLWFAFAAGSDSWGETEPPNVLVDQASRLVEVLCLLVAGSWPIVWLLASGDRLGTRDIVLFALLVLSLAVLGIPVLRGRRRPTEPWRSAARRTVCGSIALACWAGLAPDLALLGAWPIGVAAGADIARTSLTLGVPLRPGAWLGRFLRSPVHIGVVLALVVGAWLLTARSGTLRIVLLYGAFLLTVTTAWLAIIAVVHLDRRVQIAREDFERRVVEREHRRRGHWLHDDVCSDLRSARLRIESGSVAEADVGGLLDDLEHQLRMRQLDEFIDAGSVRLAEIIQPYVRRAQQEGVTIEESPTLDSGGVVVAGDTARLVQRAMGVLVPNAMHAGSPSIAVRLRVTEGTVEVEVEDHGGGFDLDTVPLGRGLDRLRDELGPEHLRSTRTDDGSIVQAIIALRPPGEPALRPSRRRAAETSTST